MLNFPVQEFPDVILVDPLTPRFLCYSQIWYGLNPDFFIKTLTSNFLLKLSDFKNLFLCLNCPLVAVIYYYQYKRAALMITDPRYSMYQVQHTATKIPFMFTFSGNCAASVPISTFMCLWAIIHVYYQDGSTYFLQQNRQIYRGNI
jgi:hypothetical protein